MPVTRKFLGHDILTICALRCCAKYAWLVINITAALLSSVV